MELIGYIVAGVAAWVSLGYIAGAYSFAYGQREFPLIAERTRSGDRRMSLFLACLGPLGLLIGVGATASWGLMNGRGTFHGLNFNWPWA